MLSYSNCSFNRTVRCLNVSRCLSCCLGKHGCVRTLSIINMLREVCSRSFLWKAGDSGEGCP